MTEIEMLRLEINSMERLLDKRDATIMELRAEVDRLNRHMVIAAQAIADRTCERDDLLLVVEEHFAALDKVSDEGFAEIHEVEVPNEDEVVSYGGKK